MGNGSPQRRNRPKAVPKVKGIDMGCTLAQAEGAKSSGCEFTTYPAASVNPVPIWSELPPDFAVRGTSVCGRVTSAPLRKANWLADRLHSIGRCEGRRQSIPGKWTRWGLSEGQEGEPIRTEAMGGPTARGSMQGVPKAFIRRPFDLRNEMDEKTEIQRKKWRIASRKKYDRLRNEMFDALGRECAECAECGESREHVLTLDHRNNDGAVHRRELTGGKYLSSMRQVVYDARRNGWPSDVY